MIEASEIASYLESLEQNQPERFEIIAENYDDLGQMMINSPIGRLHTDRVSRSLEGLSRSEAEKLLEDFCECELLELERNLKRPVYDCSGYDGDRHGILREGLEEVLV